MCGSSRVPRAGVIVVLERQLGVAALRIELLGGFRVVVGADAVAEESWTRRRAAAVVKLLALAPGHRLPRERLMDLLWPELDPVAAAANLRKAVHYARRVLGSDGPRLLGAAGELLLLLGSADVWVDVDAFHAVVSRARRGADVVAYVEAVELYGDGLLPEDRYEDWAIEWREALRTEFLQVAEELASMLEARGDLEGATRMARRLVAEEPTGENHAARLMRLHALAGRRAEALREYRRLDESLAELGVEPSPSTQRLYEEVRSGGASEPQLSAQLWERVGDLRLLAGDTRGAARAFGSALTASVGDSACLHRKIAGAWLMEQAPDVADVHLDAAEKIVTEPSERGRLVCLRATQAWQRGDLDRAARLAEQARTLAEAHGDVDDLVAAVEALVIVSHLRGDWRQALQLEIQRCATEGQRRTILARVCDIHHCIGQYHLYGDGLANDVEDYARGVLVLAEEADAVRAQAFAWCLLGESLLLRGRWDEATGCLQRSCELLVALGPRSRSGLPWQRLAELAVCRGRVADAEALLRRASAIATVSPMAKHLWGRVHATAAFAALERGDPAAAAQSVYAAAAAAARYGDCATCSALLNPMAAQAFALLGDRENTYAYARAAMTVAGSFDSSAWRAMAESAAGNVAALDGDVRRARQRFEAAASLYDRAQQPYWAQRSRDQAAAVAAGNVRGTARA